MVDQVPEHIWIELILSDYMFEIYCPPVKRTEKINQAYNYMKNIRDHRQNIIKPEWETEFAQTLSTMNKYGSSAEHNKWRRQVIKYASDIRAPNKCYMPSNGEAVVFRDMGGL